MVTTNKGVLTGWRRITMPRFALAMVALMVTAIGANAQDLSENGTSPLAVSGISQPGKFPIKITKSGSYRLNSNLTVKSGVSADAIDVLAPNVTIDLSGFTITGGVIAINGSSSEQVVNVTVSNGSVTGSGAGVLLGNGAVVRNVRVSNLTGGSGFSNAITGGTSSTLTGNTVYTVTASNPHGPASAIVAGQNSLVLNNTVTGTIGGSGIAIGVGGNSVVSGNTSSNNADSGILLAGPGVIVSHNTANNNATGLDFVSGAGAYEDNVLLDNTTADVQGGTSLAGGNTNLCTGGLC